MTLGGVASKSLPFRERICGSHTCVNRLDILDLMQATRVSSVASTSSTFRSAIPSPIYCNRRACNETRLFI